MPFIDETLPWRAAVQKVIKAGIEANRPPLLEGEKPIRMSGSASRETIATMQKFAGGDIYNVRPPVHQGTGVAPKRHYSADLF